MKHLNDEHRRYFERLLREAGLSIPGDVAGAVLRHIDWVLERSSSLNLTAITEPYSAVRLHGVDSLLALTEVSRAPSGALVDLGTGAGFPGVPLGLATGRETLLVDSTGKKCAAIAEFLEAEQPRGNIAVQCGRAETLGLSERGRFAVATARAVAPLASLVELAAPLLCEGGYFVALKGQLDGSELASGDVAARLVGMSAGIARATTLPDGGETRTIVQYVRTGDLRVSLPRRVGMAQSRPLA